MLLLADNIGRPIASDLLIDKWIKVGQYERNETFKKYQTESAVSSCSFEGAVAVPKCQKLLKRLQDGMKILNMFKCALHYKSFLYVPPCGIEPSASPWRPRLSCHLTPSQTSLPEKGARKTAPLTFLPLGVRHLIFPSSLWLILPNLMHEREQKRERKKKTWQRS